MAQETEARTPVITRPWVKVLLGVSLALNLAVLGVGIGAALRFADPDRRVVVRDVGFGPWSAALDRDDRAALHKRFLTERGRLSEGWRADRADRAALVAVLRADPLDLAALDALTARIAARGQDRVELGQALIRAHIVDMTPAQRAAFADRLAASLQGHHDRKPQRD
jgi:uncharacterized membrane protein